MIGNLANRITTGAANAGRFLTHIAGGKTEDDRRPVAHFDVSDPRLERYFYCLVKFFDIAGFRVSLRFRPRLLLNLRNYNDLLYNIGGMQITYSQPAETAVTITDKGELALKGDRLFIDVRYFEKEKHSAGFVFPYSMHPLIYDRGIYKTISDLRTRERKMRIFSYFANLQNYAGVEMNAVFGKLNRRQIGEEILSYPDSIPLNVIRRRSELAMSRSGSPRLVAVDNLRIPFEDWLPTLAGADFFVAAPGVLMPYCHNLIESMAVGTVPITEYPEMWDPPLEDRVNCIAFDGVADLRKRICEVLEMSSDEVAEMRQAAIEYYDTWFDPVAAVSRLMENLPELERLYLLAGHLSVTSIDRK
ncbi:MAG: hypothetical protein DWQ47_08365 [Acidobacteria bacterium]|nr:MAG: hypothetical protein DWQ32_16465 [Acidobacteriota bacterium]REJ99077.1 MAG: hypothetical protein DWQ38_13515 [Acidobacteriota bacterium]REK16203.1 MAG: hypothetical protein DWQ43_04175 [Acidobacteriota bacterium]REK43884.1 MAG: hypothetical protein DWQ47_08365 [Acidobacteriota bacterium]